jgi:hypothetical protein
MIERATKRRLRAGAIFAFWLSYAALPLLLVAFRPADPFACCRGNGKHQCFMRARGAQDELALRKDVKACATATIQAVAVQAAVLAVPLALDHHTPCTRMARSTSRVAPFFSTSSCASRAPPLA